MMRVDIRYGKGFKSVDLPENTIILKKPETRPIGDPIDGIKKSLQNPISSKPLIDIAKGRRNACIVVSDTTRPVPNSIILPPLIELLEQAGIRDEDITILIATGTHDPVPDEMFEELLGRDTLRHSIKIVNHNAYDDSMIVDLGKGAYDCPALINRIYAESDLKICTGLIEPHFMAGFSGGRKSICPGITGIETLKIFHSVDAMGHPLSKSCSLNGNPVDKMAKSVAKIAGCDFMVNVSLDDQRRITGIFSGDLFKAHETGCEFVSDHSIVEIEKEADVVVTSNGGYPLDQNYYQTAKGLVEASEIVKKDGFIIMASECKFGFGKSSFRNLMIELKEKGTKVFLDSHRTSQTFESDQWEVQEFTKVFEKTKNILLLSSLNKSDQELTFARPIKSLNEGVRIVTKSIKDPFIVAIPEGPYVVGRIKN
ncbi:nickel-dependent lactate racemase family protein [Athalassotoga saccharophila]|uniref:nickel-dependent lactate racemase n=1 Tax=Athalassotoga saccharophila TaxID=1441386 RepID=UPI00137B4DDC|nr:nickel-dependent lactate racemase [Athalassotoga saccharophila]BBJ27371.1 lactate racemase [Athalassotoga saccharophila]